MRLQFALAALAFTLPLLAQTQETMKPADTEVWEPVPKVVTPGMNNTAPPSDAIVLFDGTNLD